MTVVSKPIRRSAAGEECTLHLPGCNWDPDTTVLAHLRTEGAAGGGEKPDDWHAVYACSDCHQQLDLKPWNVTGQEKLNALRLTQRRLYEKGLLKVPESLKVHERAVAPAKPAKRAHGTSEIGRLWKAGKGSGD